MTIVRLLLLLLTAVAADAANLTTESGTLALAQAATGASTNTVDLGSDYRGSIWITITESGTTTVQIEQSTDGTNFGVVTFDAATTSPLVFVDPTAISVHIDSPTGKYRVNTTTCTACSMTATYRMGPSLH